MRVGDHLIDVDWLRKNHTSLHPFGLGFLQLKLNPTERIHFWHPGFKREREEVHNHRYDFISTILRGEMTQEIYHFQNVGFESINYDYEVFETNCAPGQEGDQKVIAVGNLQPVISGTFIEGVTYKLNHDTFHRIAADRCVTFLSCGEKIKTHARVIRECGTTSACPFAESVPDEVMWEMIEDCLQ